jgi:large subunit ribosomal protein L9
MAIEVLLRRSIEGVGAVGEVVRVKNGYARNYLLPYQMAALVTPDALRNIEKDKAAEAVREAEEAKDRAALAEKLASIQVRIESRAGEDGHLYGSVGPRQVVDELKRHGLRFEERQVRFETVRQLGEYEVPIHLSRQHVIKLKLWVVLDPEDAKAHAENAERRAAEEAAMARYAAENPRPAAAAEGESSDAGVPAASADAKDADRSSEKGAEKGSEKGAEKGSKGKGKGKGKK